MWRVVLPFHPPPPDIGPVSIAFTAFSFGEGEMGGKVGVVGWSSHFTFPCPPVCIAFTAFFIVGEMGVVRSVCTVSL